MNPKELKFFFIRKEGLQKQKAGKSGIRDRLTSLKPSAYSFCNLSGIERYMRDQESGPILKQETKEGCLSSRNHFADVTFHRKYIDSVQE